jgi:hypothetical protein
MDEQLGHALLSTGVYVFPPLEDSEVIYHYRIKKKKIIMMVLEGIHNIRQRATQK